MQTHNPSLDEIRRQRPLRLLDLPREILLHILQKAKELDDESLDDSDSEDESEDGSIHSAPATAPHWLQTSWAALRAEDFSDAGEQIPPGASVVPQISMTESHELSDSSAAARLAAETAQTGAEPVNLETSSAPEQKVHTDMSEDGDPSTHRDANFDDAGIIDALYRTCKELHELCKPLFWERVDFEGEPNKYLKRFEELCLDKYASYIKELYIRQAVDEEEREWYDEDEGLADEDYVVKPRIAFLFRCLEVIPDLRLLDIDIWGGEAQSKRVKKYRNRLLNAIARHRNLEIVHLQPSPIRGNAIYQPWAANVLRRLTKLKDITLQYLSPADGTDDLPHAIASLAHLEILELVDCNLSTSWSRVQLAAEPREIHIGLTLEAENSQEAIENFIENNGAQLRRLTVDTLTFRSSDPTLSLPGVHLDSLDESFKPLKLPNLRNLCVTLTDTGVAFLERFLGCPLTSLSIQVAEITCIEWIVFVKARRFPALRRLEIPEDSNEDFSDLEVECQRQGIKLIVEGSMSLLEDGPDADGMFGDEDSWIDEQDYGADDVYMMMDEWEADGASDDYEG